MLKHTAAVVALALAAVTLTSCGTRTNLVSSSWELPGEDVGPYQKVLVVAAARDNDHRDALEDAIVDQLERDGVDGIAGHTVMDDNINLPLDDMEKIVAGTGADAVMVAKIISVGAGLDYTPPTRYATTGAAHDHWWSDPYWGYYSPYPYHYWGYWYPAAQVTSAPGYWSTSVFYRMETALYRTSDNRLVWTAMSKTFDPESEYDLGKSMARRITARMERVGLIEG